MGDISHDVLGTQIGIISLSLYLYHYIYGYLVYILIWGQIYFDINEYQHSHLVINHCFLVIDVKKPHLLGWCIRSFSQKLIS